MKIDTIWYDIIIIKGLYLFKGEHNSIVSLSRRLLLYHGWISKQTEKPHIEELRGVEIN